ncbi:hypothetical protein SAMN02745866_01240 [Alteromonadaceae bacterium Bs31]|nr:hypothetical protein SAMN02745866_01240 [Alteromonadaceae bacterium Bs31]
MDFNSYLRLKSVLTTATIGVAIAGFASASFAQQREDIKTLKYEATPVKRAEITRQLLPPVKNVRVFELEKHTESGFNAVTMIEFERDAKHSVLKEGSFVSVIDGKKILFNDFGKEADVREDDGIFSGFAKVDFEGIEKYDARLKQSLDRKDGFLIKTFSGRVVKKTRKTNFNELQFELEKQLLQDSLLNARELKLANGLVAFNRPSLSVLLSAIPFTADENKVLGINTPSVVAHPDFTYDPCDTDGTGNDSDPDAPWSFKMLMSKLNQGTGLSDQEFIHEWLMNWRVNGNINGFTINARPNIIDYFSGWDGANAATLDIDNLPFRLLAVMNRLDLAKVSYLSATEGETRFVFGLLNPNTCAPAGVFDELTVIFEYGDTADTCSTIKSRAQQWLDLDNLTPGTAAYMNALKAITDDVSEPPNAPATLNQLRTNDFAFDGLGAFTLPWELREFIVDSGTGLLVPDTIKQTPDESFRTGNATTALFMKNEANDILCETHVVTNNYNNASFLGASIEYLGSSFWSAPVNPADLPGAYPACYQSSISGVAGGLPLSAEIHSEVRHKLSINTCDDCHARETNTGFTHVDPASRNFSGFMTGNIVNDPLLGSVGSGGLEREFDDLQRRGQIVQDFASKQCSGGLIFNSSIISASLPSVFTH